MALSRLTWSRNLYAVPILNKVIRRVLAVAECANMLTVTVNSALWEIASVYFCMRPSRTMTREEQRKCDGAAVAMTTTE
ncbi:hypothetical protein C9I56_34140 [Paraburkholderia caribensis]|nr:hypothetical protein C9I56_34140 [Paraburkholderia caribensis]